MRELPFGSEIEKAEFVYLLEFMAAKHNYLCAVCREKSAILDLNSGILQPCWGCQGEYTLIKKRRKGWLTTVVDRVHAFCVRMSLRECGVERLWY